MTPKLCSPYSSLSPFKWNHLLKWTSAAGSMDGQLIASVLGVLERFWDSPPMPESETDGLCWRNVSLKPSAFDGMPFPSVTARVRLASSHLLPFVHAPHRTHRRLLSVFTPVSPESCQVLGCHWLSTVAPLPVCASLWGPTTARAMLMACACTLR